MTNSKGILRGGLRLLWRRQSVLWWLFAVNLALGYWASVPVRLQLGFLDHTFAADALYHRFELTRLAEVMMKHEVNTSVALSGSLGLMLAYLVFMLFVTGGILETFYDDRRVSTAEFFRACGQYFWRMVRLMLVFAVVLVPLLIASGSLRNWTQKLSDESPREQLGFWVLMGGVLLLVLVALALRLWFDLAQVHAVAENSLAIRRSLGSAWRLARRARIYAIFVGINLAGFVAFTLLVLLWMRLPHERVGWSWLLAELMALVWVATRLWERAAEVVYYQQLRPAEAVPPVTPAASERVSESLEAPPAVV